MEYFLGIYTREKGLVNKLRPLFGLEPRRSIVSGQVVEVKSDVLPVCGQIIPISLFGNLTVGKLIPYVVYRVDLQPITLSDNRPAQEIERYLPRVYVESAKGKDYYVPEP